MCGLLTLERGSSGCPRELPRPDRWAAFLPAASLGEPPEDPRRHRHRHRRTPSATAASRAVGPRAAPAISESCRGCWLERRGHQDPRGTPRCRVGRGGCQERAGPSRLVGATSPPLSSGNPRTPSCAQPVPVMPGMTRPVAIDSWGSRSGQGEGGRLHSPLCSPAIPGGP